MLRKLFKRRQPARETLRQRAERLIAEDRMQRRLAAMSPLEAFIYVRLLGAAAAARGAV